MAISKNTGIDFAKIALEMRSITERWYNASVEIIDPNLEDQAWNMATNTFTNAPESTLWSGKARIQPLGNGSVDSGLIMQNGISAIRVQIPYDVDLPLIRKGLQVKVTDGGEDHVLESLQFVVRSAVNSSYGWNRTIECDVDVKSASDG